MYPKSGYDVRRERDVFGLYAAFEDIPHIESLGPSPDTHAIPSDYVPKSAADPSLAAFCQLAAMRLNSARSLISLIDDKYQYILAEATPNTSLRTDSPLNKANDLGFGNVRLPRRWGVCERVLDPEAAAEGNDGIVIINDFTKHEQYSNRSYVRDGPLRFYAGVPLTLPSGSIVGAVCILDNVVREGLSQDDIIYLQDLAGIIVDYLDTYAIKDKYRRAAKGLHGLMSFAEGGTTSRSSSERCQSFQSAQSSQGEAAPDFHDERPAQSQQNVPSDQNSQHRPHSPSSSFGFLESHKSLDDLQNDLVPAMTKSLFARASAIMRHSNDMSGVMFIDASYASRGSQSTLPLNTGKHCQILGFATDSSSSLNGDVLSSTMVPYESNFKCVLEQYPHGYSLDCAEGDEKPGYEDRVDRNERPSMRPDGLQESHKLEVVTKDRSQLSARVKALIPDAKSALFLPLWDFERRRWFAGCFCWSTKTERRLDGRLDLPFLKAFGHSIMQEVARLDSMSTSQAKTTFLSSLSHELRTPLHGILGSVHLMRNSRLDNFQSSMLNAITVCGRTLLETVEHLLDHAERPETRRNYSSTISRGERSICISSEPLTPETPTHASDKPRCDVGFVTEEVVETMIVGESPFNITLDGNGQDDQTLDQTSDHASNRAIARRRSRFIILDISDYRDLGFRLSASSFGRIVMNLFGNALKFTETGFVHVTVKSEELSCDRGTVVFTVSDSGVGMTPHFLLENAFEPFRKQNEHTSGTGVGLSVVRRILEDIGGQITVSSEPSKGTDIVLKLPLPRVTAEEGQDPKMNPLPVAMLGVKGCKVCILHPGSESSAILGQEKRQQVVQRYIDALTATLKNALQVDARLINTWDASDDTEVVICPEISFESLQMVRENAAKAGRSCPAVVLIAMDILEAETLRCDARVTSKASIVETITQPVGPYKLSVALNACLQRYHNTNPGERPTTPKRSRSPFTEPHTPPSTPFDQSSQFRPKMGLYPPLAIRANSSTKLEYTLPQEAQKDDQTQAPTAEAPAVLATTEKTKISQALIVDDNAINRRLLSAWMKKRKIPYKEAKDGQEALDTYKDANGAFELILMDISMPKMDGMTSTRLIREYEKKKDLTPAHVIALTGLTSASAKLEAWTSGVDDFLTKPVDFKKLESLMDVGRRGEGTGFITENKRLG